MSTEILKYYKTKVLCPRCHALMKVVKDGTKKMVLFCGHERPKILEKK